jgi:hypothetical protein
VQNRGSVGIVRGISLLKIPLHQEQDPPASQSRGRSGIWGGIKGSIYLTKPFTQPSRLLAALRPFGEQGLGDEDRLGILHLTQPTYVPVPVKTERWASYESARRPVLVLEKF